MINREHFVIFLWIVLFFSCSDPDSDPEDCAGITNGSSICGCTDSTAFNYNSTATHDDGSCKDYLDNGDYFLYFNGPEAYVNLGDVMSQGSYTKAAWVRRLASAGNLNNILSGNTGHAFWAPEDQGGRLSAGHNGNYSSVQDPDPLPESEWIFVAVTFDDALEKLTLYTNGVQVSEAIGIDPPNESTSTYISRFASGYGWNGSIDEVAIWDKALSNFEISELSETITNMDAMVNRADYISSANLIGYWKMNEGEGDHLSDASGNMNTGLIYLATWTTCDDCGCTDESACNHDPSATIDNRSCTYIEGECEVCVDGQIVDFDNDLDSICDSDDVDDDNDNVPDQEDTDPFNSKVCSDIDGDGCDDCSSGVFDISNDGPDDDSDGICNQCGSTDTTFSTVLTGTAGYDIIRSTGCSYVVSGSINGTIVMKIDEFGNEIWSGTYDEISGSHWGNSVNTTNDGGYIIGSAQNTIIKTDSVGVMEWYQKLSYSVSHFVEDVIQTSEGDYIVVGGVGGDPLGGHAIKGKAFILRMSEGGGIQWVKRYGIIDTPANTFWGVVEADDGGFVLAGEKLEDRNFEFYDHFWVMKTDFNGDEEWSIESGGNLWDEARDIIKLSDGSYIVTGMTALSSTNLNMRVMRVSPTGDILWQNNHGDGNNEKGTSITLSQNEDMVAIVGYTRSNSGSPFKYRIWGVDVVSGQILWNQIHGGSQEDKAFGVAESYDNGFNIVGSSYSFGSNRVNWLIKTDSLGRVD